MSETRIPDHLIHRPEEVERNAGRFDELCRLAEEIAFPIVREALLRETTATGAEALVNEARLALQDLVGDEAFQDFDESRMLDEVRRSLESTIPPPDEKECHALARDAVQMVMGTWVEMLHSDLSRIPSLVLHLSDQLLPIGSSSKLTEDTFRPWTKTPELLSEALGSLGLAECEAGDIMKALRTKLFSSPSIVELPLELVIAGGPGMGVLAMTRSTYDGFLAKIQLRARAAAGIAMYARGAAPVAAANLIAPLPLDLYEHLQHQASDSEAHFERLAGRQPTS